MHRIFSFLLFVSTLTAEPADWIWSARYVITENAQRRVIENGAVAVRGERIVGVGTRAEVDARFQARQRLDRPEEALYHALRTGASDRTRNRKTRGRQQGSRFGPGGW